MLLKVAARLPALALLGRGSGRIPRCALLVANGAAGAVLVWGVAVLMTVARHRRRMP